MGGESFLFSIDRTVRDSVREKKENEEIVLSQKRAQTVKSSLHSFFSMVRYRNSAGKMEITL